MITTLIPPAWLVPPAWLGKLGRFGGFLDKGDDAARTSRGYRAVSEAEYQDILKTGQFRQGPNSLEGKWFSDSLDGARLHGEALEGAGKYRLIEADVPNNAPSLFRQPNLDGRGPSRYFHLDDLQGVVPRPSGGG
jgi:hypothetical protein